jgi:primary-amine oxidase
MAEMSAVIHEGRGPQVPVHPLDPLSAGELQAVVDGVREARRLDHRHLFVTVQLDEPDKQSVVSWREGDSLDRTARVAIWDQSTASMSEAIMSATGEVREWRELPSAMAPVLLPQAIAAIDATKADPHIDGVHIETWPFGGLIPEALADGKRLVWTPIWERKTPDDNQYAHPVYGLYAVIDLDTGTVIDVEDHGELPVPQESGHYRQSQLGEPRALRELEITQPAGPSFTVDGWRVEWQKWAFRIGFCPREGLLIHDVRYDDDGNERRIAHRMSIAELVIPYGDPSPGSYRKNAFDTGEVGVGYYTNSLTLGCDCLGEVRYLDVTIADHDGTVRTIENGICMHEEDVGILWKHTDTDGHVEVRRSRRFVASSFVTIDNYEYGYFWYFYQDGSIEFEAKLTGIVLTLASAPAIEARYATEIAPGLLAPYHQHIFCARLDLDIDGRDNTVVEVDAVGVPWGPDNPYGGAFMAQETPLTRESAAKRRVDPMRSRYWKVINSERLNHVGRPVGYKLLPGHTTYPLALPDSSIGLRAAFMYNHLWVSPFSPDERYPAGEFPFQHPGGAGLPEWTEADRETDCTDVVVWYVFGTNHFPRSEDWPVMPVDRAGFHLKPVNFFRHNPGLDVPSSHPDCGHDHKDA